MKLPRAVLCALSLSFTLALASPMFAQQLDVPDDGTDAVATDETPSLWFVELASAPTADGTSLTTVRNEKAAFRNAAKKAGLLYTERFAYDTLFNGLSVQIDRSQLSTLRRIDGVKTLWPIGIISLPNTPVVGGEPDLFTSVGMIGGTIAQNTLGFTGHGIKVAVMDTGIDYHHPDLGGCFGPGCRVTVGWDFVGDAYDANTNPNPVPDADPMDCAGHGTHVAGIIGAKAASATGVTGVAPGVTFGAYRVFGCAGSTSDDIMLAAMERLLADGMQVLNMSIGSAFTWPQYPTAVASNRLVNKGVVVVASIGNSGANGIYSAGAPGAGAKVIGVASVDNTFSSQPAFSITPDNLKIGYNAATGAPPPPVSGTFPMARTGTTTTTNDACVALAAGSLTGKVVLIRRGTCTFGTKALNAQNAGAAGVVLYNNAAGTVSPTVAPTPITIPVVAITAAAGSTINGRLAAGPVDLTWGAGVVSAPSSTAGLISSFSSYGLAPDLTLKPDISAPGGNIFSTFPIALGSYASLSGTSMASPHVAGSAALLLEAHPKTPAQIVGTILENSSSPRLWWGNPGLGFLDNVHRQGAGLVQIDKAILATTKIEPGKLALGESQFGPSTSTITLTNSSSADVTYDLSNAGALATGPNTFTPSFFLGDATATFSSGSVTVPANGSASVNATIAANATLPDNSVYGGYLVFTPEGGGQTYRVPYAGFKGDYQSIVILTPTANGFPWLARAVGTSFAKQLAGATYTLAGGDIPYVLVHLDHFARKLVITINDAATGKAWGRAFDDDYLPRSSSASGFFSLSWDGTTTAGSSSKVLTVPNGTYTATLTVEKALGSDGNPADWESWTSPPFVIARP